MASRPAQFGLGQNPAPEAWVSELAEELAGEIERGLDPGSISLRIREVAAERRLPDHWTLTHMIAREWDRLGIRRTPRSLQVGGW
jgi:hypothetical protein